MKEKVKSAIIAILGTLVALVLLIASAVQFMTPKNGADLIYSKTVICVFGVGLAVLFFLCFVYVFSHIEE